MKLRRRELLFATVAAGAGGLLQVVLGCREPDGLESRFVLDLAARYQNPAALRLVGAEAGRVLGEGPETLLAELAPSRGTERILGDIRDEYRRGDTLDVHGWALSRTEARIYALVALVPERDA